MQKPKLVSCWRKSPCKFDFSGWNEAGRKQAAISVRLNMLGESIWAYLPVGPLERQIRKGSQGGIWEEVPKNPQERVVLLWRDIWGSLC